MPETPTALIIGASRGLGLAMCAEYLKRGWRVMGTVRGAGSAELEALAAQSDGRLEIERVDINDPAQVAALAARLAGRRFALLFVNAGVSNGPSERVDAVSTKSFTEVMVTNALSPMRVIAALEELVPAGGTIGAMSSGLGSVADNDRGGWEVYRASKAALNTLMRSFAARQAGDGRGMVVIAPGWVRTDMGGPAATLGIEDSIPKVVDTILGLAGKPGLQYLNYLGQTLRW